MATKQSRVTRRLFLKRAAAVAAAPYLIPASARGAGGRPAPSERITMGFVGVGGQGSGDMGGFMGFPEVQAVAVCNVDRRPGSAAKQHGRGTLCPAAGRRHLQGLRRLRRFPRPLRPARHRRRLLRHARPLARPGHLRGHAQRQGRLLREAGNAHHPRRADHGRDGPPLRPRLLRRQPAGLGRLQLVPPHDVVRHGGRAPGGFCRHRRPVRRDAPAGRAGAALDGLGACGSARPPGGPTTRPITPSTGAAAATFPAAA